MSMIAVVLVQCPSEIIHIAYDHHVSGDVQSVIVHVVPSYTVGMIPYTAVKQ